MEGTVFLILHFGMIVELFTNECFITGGLNRRTQKSILLSSVIMAVLISLVILSGSFTKFK